MGAVAGTLNVTASGGASYAIPLDLPPAAGHLVPKLTLAYGSYNGNGAMGVGFKLEGLSMVARAGKNKLLDGRNAPIAYIDAEDNFTMGNV